MAVDLGSARLWASALMREHIEPGMFAIDATMGNGADTELLAHLVGDAGCVWAFDVQEGALTNTRARLIQAGMLPRVQLILDGHEHMAAHVPAPVHAITFNLGWLPGGDKHITTRTPTTLLALEAALTLLAPKGLLTLCIYPGHGEGAREQSAVCAWAKCLPPTRFQSRTTAYLNQPPSAPLLIAVQKMR